MRRTIARFMDLLFGPDCSNGCGHRVYPKDHASHAEVCWAAVR